MSLVKKIRKRALRTMAFDQFVATACPNWRLREVMKNEYPYVDDHKSQAFSGFYAYERLKAAGGSDV